MIALLDYGAGNLTSVRRAFAAAGAPLDTAAHPADLDRARALIVPGVGHFAATASLDDRWREAVRRFAASGRPLLGICLGMQWLYTGSSEADDVPGLGLLEGRCRRLDDPAWPDEAPGPGPSGATSGDPTGGPAGCDPPGSPSNPAPEPPRLKIPHVGWNRIALEGACPLFAGTDPGEFFYFTHAWAAPVTSETVAVTRHGVAFAAAVARDRVFGVQFHPEKSGAAGLRLIAGFLEVARQ